MTENKNILGAEGKGTPNLLVKEIDSLIKFMKSPDRDFLTEETITKPFPRDTKIYPNSNKDKPFSDEGVEERRLEHFSEKLKAKRLLIEKGEVTQEELNEISIELSEVKLRIKESGIQSRFDILDL